MTIQLTIQKRAKVLDSNTKSLSVAGVVYGPKFPSTPIMMDRKEFEKIYKESGESTVLSLVGLDGEMEALIKDVEYSPIKNQVTHVDFYVIEKGKEVTAHVPLHFVGESEAVKSGAMIDKVLHEVTVTAKAANLPAHLDIDLGLIKTVEDKIHVSDIKLGAGVKMVSDGHEVVAKAEMIKDEPVEEAATAPAAEPQQSDADNA